MPPLRRGSAARPYPHTQTTPMATALAARRLLLWCLLLLLLLGHAAAVASAQQPVPACSELRLHVKSKSWSVRPGSSSVVLMANLANKGGRKLSGVNIRLDVPPGLVAQSSQAGAPIVVNGSATAYWTGLTLKPGKRRKLKLKVHACATATPGSYPLGGAVYLVNTTSNAVTCLSPAAGPALVVRRGRRRGGVDHFSIHAHSQLAPCDVQIRIKKQSKGWRSANIAASCPTPAPTPVDGPGYTMYGENQRLVDGVLVGYTGGGGDGCQALCSGAGFTRPFYFSVEKTGSGACYCSQDK